MPKLLRVAADVDRSFLERVAADARFETVVRPARHEEELAAEIGDTQVLVTRAHNRVTRRVLDAARRLELIAQGTSGIDNIDLDAAREKGVAIVHLPGVNAAAVAELVMGSMIALTRTAPLYTREMMAGRWTRDDCATRHELRHHRLGILGLGEVGRRVARLAGAFGLAPRAYDPYLEDGEFAARGADRVSSLPALLGSSDIVTLHVPLTTATRGMVGGREIASMPRGSFLINTARGEVLDTTAALEALASGHLAGLALDVFDPEPPDATWPDDPRLILTPHVAGCTFESKAAIGTRLYARIVGHYGWELEL